MEKFKFDATTFEALQRLIFPLVEIFLDFDPANFVGEKSVLFSKTGDALSEASELFYVAASALEDGLLTAEEIEEIISKAISVGEAISKIAGYLDFSSEDTPEEE